MMGAKVYKAKWMGGDAAVKVMDVDKMAPGIKQQLMQGLEVNSSCDITHPNIVQTFHVYKVQKLGV
jgi:hypothetical protein